MNHKKRNSKRALLAVTATMLLALLAVSFTACGDTNNTITATSSAAAESVSMHISFDSCGGSAVQAAEIGKDGTIAMPADPTWKKDYTFAGWYTDTAYTAQFANSALGADATVYAKWTKDGNTVRTTILDLYEVTEDLSNPSEGWAWTAANKTLTLSGFTLDTAQLDVEDSAAGIVLPRCAKRPADDEAEHTHNQDCPTSTINLTDGTVNTVDLSRLTDSSYSTPVYSDTSLTIKASGHGTPGKLNATGAHSKGVNFAIYTSGDLTVEGGDITAIAGESIRTRSVGLETSLGNIYIQNGTVTAIGGVSGAKPSGENASGSYGIRTNVVQINGGSVTATGGRAETSLSAGILGTHNVEINGGNILAKGDIVAISSFMKLTMETAFTVNGSVFKIAAISAVDPNENVLHTFVDDTSAVLKDVVIQS